MALDAHGIAACIARQPLRTLSIDTSRLDGGEFAGALGSVDFKLPCKLLRVQLSQRRHNSLSHRRK
jgi:hypothetical protein